MCARLCQSLRWSKEVRFSLDALSFLVFRWDLLHLVMLSGTFLCPSRGQPGARQSTAPCFGCSTSFSELRSELNASSSSNFCLCWQMAANTATWLKMPLALPSASCWAALISATTLAFSEPRLAHMSLADLASILDECGHGPALE